MDPTATAIALIAALSSRDSGLPRFRAPNPPPSPETQSRLMVAAVTKRARRLARNRTIMGKA